MSNMYSRLNRILKTQKPTNAIKFKQRTPTPTPTPRTEQTPPTRTPQRSNEDPNPSSKGLVKDLLAEKDSKKLFQKFNSLSEYSDFRRQHKVHEVIVHRLALAKQFSLIEEALERQKKYISDEQFAARIIFLYGKAGMFDHAQKVFDELPERKCERGARSFQALLGAAVNSQKFDKVVELFRELPTKLSIEPYGDSYGTAAHALCKLGLLDDAVSLLDDMEANGLKPGVPVFSALLGAFYGKGDFVEGDKLWDRMIKSNATPDMCSYGYKAQGLVGQGKLTEAIELVEELKRKYLKLNLLVFNAVIQGVCKEDDLDGARKWFDDLLKHGCVPSKTTFDILVPFLCDKGDYGFAFKVCEIKLKSLCLVDEASLQNVVDGLVKNSMIEEAKKLVELGRSHSYFSYNLVIHSTA